MSRVDSVGRVVEMHSMQLPYPLYDTTAIVVDDVLYCFGGETTGETLTDEWFIWDFNAESTTPAPPTPNPTDMSTTATDNSTDFGAASITETPTETVITVATCIGLWICCVMTCLIMQCFGISDILKRRLTKSNVNRSALNLAEYVNQRQPTYDSQPQPVTTTAVAVQPSVATVATIAMDPVPTVNPKIALASSLEDAVSDSDCDGNDVSNQEGMDTEGMEGATTGTGGTATLNVVPSMTASKSGRMTAIVDAEQLSMEQWLAEKERMDRESVRTWLRVIGYSQYFDIFVNNGLCRMREVERIQNQEELQAIGVMDLNDRIGLVAAIRVLRK